jgi:predicted RNase H-like HicB family nuclease
VTTWRREHSTVLLNKQVGKIEVFMKYAVVIEKTQTNYSAYVPDLPGCVATGQTLTEVESEIQLAIELHIQGLLEDDLTVPSATSIVEYIEAIAA